MKKPPLGLTQIFWGEGKGKTTAALGAALRACGQGYTVHLVQFMKNGTGNADMDNPGELRALENIPNFSYKRFGAGSWVTRTKNPRHEDSVREAVLYLKSCFGKYNFLIADEILYSVPIFLSEKEIVQLIKDKPKGQDLILTGSHRPLPAVFEFADTVTECRKTKHHFDRGILARKGIEY